MKLTRQGRRELHDEITSAIELRMGTSEFAQDVAEIVVDHTIDGDDPSGEWKSIVEKEVNAVIDQALNRLHAWRNKR